MMQPSKQLAQAAGVAFVVMWVLAYATWMIQAHLNTLHAFTVDTEVVETLRDDERIFHLQRDPENWRTEAQMEALPDAIFWAQTAMLSMGLAALVVPFIVMGKLARRKR